MIYEEAGSDLILPLDLRLVQSTYAGAASYIPPACDKGSRGQRPLGFSKQEAAVNKLKLQPDVPWSQASRMLCAKVIDRR